MPTDGRSRASARTERFDRTDVGGDDASDARRIEARSAEPTGRIGTFTASPPEPPGPAIEEPAPNSDATHHRAVQVAPSEPRPEGPGRRRRVHRAIEPAAFAARAPTQRLDRARRAPPQRAGLWILVGAIVLSALVLSAAFAVRSATEPAVASP